MSELRNNTLSTDQFNYKDRVYSAEISDFGHSFRFTQIYDDSCDRGFTLQTRTGKVANFYLAETKVQDGDLLYWKLLPTDEAVRANPMLHDASVVIFND
jgi:hypothetical protein